MALKVLRPKDGHNRKRRQTPAQDKKEGRASRTILTRIWILLGFFGVALFLTLAGRLYKLMIVDHDYYEELAINNQTRYTKLTASRGEIYDRNMNILAGSTTVETVFIDPNEIAEEMKTPENSDLLDRIAVGLSGILDVTEDFVRQQAADKAYRYKIIQKKKSSNRLNGSAP